MFNANNYMFYSSRNNYSYRWHQQIQQFDVTIYVRRICQAHYRTTERKESYLQQQGPTIYVRGNINNLTFPDSHVKNINPPN